MPSTGAATTRTAANFAGFFGDDIRDSCRRQDNSKAGRTPCRFAISATLPIPVPVVLIHQTFTCVVRTSRKPL